MFYGKHLLYVNRSKNMKIMGFETGTDSYCKYIVCVCISLYIRMYNKQEYFNLL